MATPQHIQPQSTEQGVILALAALQSDPNLTIRRAAAIYEIPSSTLHDRSRREALGRTSAIKTTKLTSSEEAAILRHVLDLDMRGFPPTKAFLRSCYDRTITWAQSRGHAVRPLHFSLAR